MCDTCHNPPFESDPYALEQILQVTSNGRTTTQKLRIRDSRRRCDLEVGDYVAIWYIAMGTVACGTIEQLEMTRSGNIRDGGVHVRVEWSRHQQQGWFHCDETKFRKEIGSLAKENPSSILTGSRKEREEPKTKRQRK